MMKFFTLHLIAFCICSFTAVERSSCTSTEEEDEVPTLADLMKMVSTREKIWMTMRTYDNPRRDCIYWLNNGLNDTDYDFFYWERRLPRPSRWNSGVAGKTHKHAKIGYLDEVPFPAMVIRAHYEKEEHARVYLLLYWLESEKCFILLHPDGECEQYTWESMTSGRHECNKVFYDTCGAWHYPVFKPSCLDPKALCIKFNSLC
ncbi:uncharacterized protein LOC119180910 isoform X2 [Rhipicephalus microplus]|uniref:uncharacterized protein LOC119180910 isoform X2 n=1 Tax=Rhipicephalus microplus TaxID=6941 RepID=UPI003F6AF4DE